MQTQTINMEPPTQKPSFLNMLTASIIGSAILFSGFIMSLFLLALSAILLPFAAFKIWAFKKQLDEHIKSSQTSDSDNSDIIEGEYVVLDDTKTDQ